jgi:site-specific DNA recombinase
MIDMTHAAIYARVSSEQQAEANTIASQVAALQARVATDGLPLLKDHHFLDEGYSGATLIRPALERLRDAAALGQITRLYVHSPDRLARKYAYQVLLIDELMRTGVEVIFLNRELGRSPEDDLLLQVQGMVAEYERAKILERSRRGKRHAAQTGAISVLSNAPYGYHYVRKQDGSGVARFEVVLPEARVVRQVFAWVGRDRLSIGEVTRRLKQAGEPTRSGKATWDRSTVWGMLKNPAYTGQAAFGKTRSAPLAPRLRAQRNGSLHPRRPVSTTDVPPEEWTNVPVPALVSSEQFAAVQEQLAENRQRARQGQRGARYLMQGLLVCAQCQYAYYGKAISTKTAKGQVRDYAYYRCIGTDAYRFGGERVCANTQVRTDLLEAAVWQEVCDLLADPARLAAEYQRRLEQPRVGAGDEVEAMLGKLRSGLTRLIDGYADGFIERHEFEPRVARLRQRISALEEQAQQLQTTKALQAELRLIIGRLEEFASKVHDRLAVADWQTRRELIRTLVKRVEIDHDQVTVVFRVNPDPSAENPDQEILHHCRRRDQPASVQHLPR